jgi:predicted Fe-Mo cluster-binding NifX family protein
VAARTLKENGVNVLLSSDIGPGATNILETIGIAIGGASQDEKVKEIVGRYLAQLEV